jgi:hypothetical protein
MTAGRMLSRADGTHQRDASPPIGGETMQNGWMPRLLTRASNRGPVFARTQ